VPLVLLPEGDLAVVLELLVALVVRPEVVPEVEPEVVPLVVELPLVEWLDDPEEVLLEEEPEVVPEVLRPEVVPCFTTLPVPALATKEPAKRKETANTE